MRATDALMGAVAAALKNDAALMAAAPQVHLLSPPPGARPPYLIVGPDVASDWSTKTEDGREHRFRVTLWLEPRAAANGAAERVETAVSGVQGTIGEHRLVTLRAIRSFADQSEKGGSTAHVTEFRARTLRV